MWNGDRVHASTQPLALERIMLRLKVIHGLETVNTRVNILDRLWEHHHCGALCPHEQSPPG